MTKKVSQFTMFALLLTFVGTDLYAQDPIKGSDTFFLAKKKGLLGRFGRSISTTPPDDNPQTVENPFLQYRFKRINKITLVGLDFDRSITDTTLRHSNIGIRIAKQVHKNTTGKVIRRNLFFY